MKISMQVKPGLSFSLISIPYFKENNSLLKIKEEGIELLFRFSPGSNGQQLPSGAVQSFEINFGFKHEYLNGFSPDSVFELNQFPDDMQHDLCPNTQMILHEIINCKLQQPLKNMFLESKGLSLLLCFQKNITTTENDCASCKFLTRPIEKEKILRAKEILLNRLTAPPTIQELSLQIGINQCYLKRGFKEMFGATVYEFVQEQRMDKAKMLLSTCAYSVARVAEEIGYSSKSNFSTAFKKHTGIFPSELQKN